MAEESLLADKAVVVTGAGAGLGRAYAQYLAGLGALVVANDVDGARIARVKESIDAAGGSCVVHVGSVADRQMAEDLIDTCVQAHGQVDGLVNNAGIYYISDPWDDREDDHRRVIDVNVLGTMHCGIAFMRQLRDAGRPGAIVNVSSGAQCGMRGQAVYSASKGAVASLTYSWAADLASEGIRVNAISPIGRPGTGYEATRPFHKDPLLVAPLVAYLVSDHSAGVTGQVFRLNAPEFGLMSHPGLFEKSVRRADWDVPTISSAVVGDLEQWFQTVGGVLCIDGESARLVPVAGEITSS